TKQPIINIALNYGFSSSQSFAKAFKQHFGVTPTAFRDCVDYQAFSELTRSSKIGHSLRKNGNVITESNSYTDSELSTWSMT
ncbi:AraC family transcriptional regulator, partial [Vibrio breoganii]